MAQFDIKAPEVTKQQTQTIQAVREHKLIMKNEPRSNHVSSQHRRFELHNVGGASSDVYSIDQKISFLEPEITEKIDEGRLYQKEIGMLDDGVNKKSGRRAEHPGTFKSSNAIAGKAPKSPPIPISG